jgi:hypothetical protein
MISIKELEALTLDQLEILVDNATDFGDLVKLQKVVSRSLEDSVRKRTEVLEKMMELKQKQQVLSETIKKL